MEQIINFVIYVHLILEVLIFIVIILAIIIFLLGCKFESITLLMLVKKLIRCNSLGYLIGYIGIYGLLYNLIRVMNFIYNIVQFRLNMIFSQGTSEYLALLITLCIIAYLRLPTKMKNKVGRIFENADTEAKEYYRSIGERIPRKLILYLFIFVVTFFNSINTFENGRFINVFPIKVDNVLLQTLATFIALDRVVANYKKGCILDILRDTFKLYMFGEIDKKAK